MLSTTKSRSASRYIGVVHGGTGHERDKSLVYGKAISKIFRDVGHIVAEIHLHPNGVWTKDGKIENLEAALQGLEAVWNALVGEDGGSGLVERLCYKCHIKILGHTFLHVELAGDKHKFKTVLKQHKVRVPYARHLSPDKLNQENFKYVFQMVGLPMIVKPTKSSGGKNIFWVNNFAEYAQAVEKIFQNGYEVLVEKPIEGKHASCFIFSYKNLLHTHVFADEILTKEECILVRNEALYIYNTLGFVHHVKYDFVVNKKGVYLIEANTHSSLLHGNVADIFKKGEVALSDYVLHQLSYV